MLGAAGATRVTDDEPGARTVAVKRAAVAFIGLMATWHFSGATGDAQTRFMYLSGQGVSPAYEGWMPNADGSFTMVFGYMNSNW